MTDHNDYDQESPGTPDSAETRQASENSPSRTPAIIEKFVIRLPNGLRNKIKHLSEQNRRSMNSEIIMVLEKHIKQHLSEDDLVNELVRSSNQHAENADEDRPADSELAKRLQNLPDEKKQALLELLG